MHLAIGGYQRVDILSYSPITMDLFSFELKKIFIITRRKTIFVLN